MLAHASALRVGIAGADTALNNIFEVLTQHFWEPEHNLYADVRDAHFSQPMLTYRGNNANMHACEAHIAAFDATGQVRHLIRARAIAYALYATVAGRVPIVGHWRGGAGQRTLHQPLGARFAVQPLQAWRSLSAIWLSTLPPH